MHYMAIVLVANGDEPEEAVATLMEPYNEEDGTADVLWWDWYQIGGRWTGALDDYNPNQDPNNREPCRQCKGTGKRDGRDCLQCGGTGEDVKWPTGWAKHAGDIQPLTPELAERITQSPPWALVLPDGTWHCKGWVHLDAGSYPDWTQEEYTAANKQRTERWRGRFPALLEPHVGTTTAVVVDYHN